MTILYEDFNDNSATASAASASDMGDQMDSANQGDVTPRGSDPLSDDPSNNIDSDDTLWQDETTSTGGQQANQPQGIPQGTPSQTTNAPQTNGDGNAAYERAKAGIHDYALKRAAGFVDAKAIGDAVEANGPQGMAQVLQDIMANLYEAAILDAHRMMCDMVQQSQTRMSAAAADSAKSAAMEAMFEQYPELAKPQYRQYAQLSYERALSKGLKGKKAQEAVVNHLRRVMPAAIKPQAPKQAVSRNDSLWDKLNSHFA